MRKLLMFKLPRHVTVPKNDILRRFVPTFIRGLFDEIEFFLTWWELM